MVEHLLTDIGHAAFADPRHQVKAAESANGQGQHQHQEKTDGLIEQLRRTSHEALIDQQADTLAQGQGDAGSNDQGEQGQQDLFAIRANETPAQTHCLTLARGKAIEHVGTRNQRFYPAYT
ncbi:hypothetical protein D3C79_631560 [compost metagenome]